VKWIFIIAASAVIVIALYFEVFGQTAIRNSSGRKTLYQKGGLADQSVYYNYDADNGILGAIGQRKVEGADKDHFEVVDVKVEFNDSVAGTTTIGKMNNEFYHEGKRIPFNPLQGNLIQIQRGLHSVHYYKTQDKIYFQNGFQYSDSLSADAKTLIPAPDEMEFKQFTRKGGVREYYLDKKKVYFMKSDKMIVVEGAEPSTFHLVTGDLEADAIDKTGRYLKGEPIESSLQVLPAL
jgi:hypothetical protein